MRRSSRPLYLLVGISLLLLCSLFLPWQSGDSGVENGVTVTASRLLNTEVFDSLFSASPPLPRIVVLGADTGERVGKKSADAEKSANEATSTGHVACNVPKLEINSSEVAGFFHDIPPLKCAGEKNWAYVKDQRFLIDDAALKRHGGAIDCVLTRFWRVDDNRLDQDRVPVSSGDKLQKSDFFAADCNATDGSRWHNLFMTIIPREDVVKKLTDIKQPPDWSGLNVYFIGFDSLSRLTFERKLRASYKYLVDEMQAVVLEGYNIVGDGTPQAFIPILTAQTEVELPLTRKRFPNANYVDIYPFIWRNYSSLGYVTLYGEDSAAIGTFTYRLKGFREQPTDHYTRTFYQRAEREIRNLKCVGSEAQHVTWFRYAEEFMSRYPSALPKFLLMHHSMLSHDDLNTVQVADEDFAEHLKRMHRDGLFDNAVVVVMADHGHRFAKLRETHQGQLEERLPFFAISLPRAFRESTRGALAYANLKANAHKLTTPFDIHETLADLLHWPSEEQLKEVRDPGKQRSMSLFRPIPETRSCAQAGVEPHWCTCLSWESAMKSDEQRAVTHMLTNILVQVINAQTEPERALCARLKVAEIVSSQRLLPHGDLLKYKSVKDADGFVPDLRGSTKLARAHYQIKFRTTPGDALYEATVLYDMHDNQVIVDLTAISHVNPYGDRPHCIIDKNYFLATYCVCYDRV